MDENDDLASQYGVVADAEGTAHPATEMAPPPPAPEPFTQADSLRFQKLQVGMTQAQEQMDDGTLSADEGHQLLRNIQALATPLALKQKRAKQQAMQEQAGDLMQQSAQLQAIDQANKVHSAQGFQDRVSTYTDAMTGKTVHLVEDGGKVRELDFSKAADAAQEGDGPTFQGQANGYYPLANAVGYEDPANPWNQLQADDAGNVRPNAPGLDGQPGDLPRDKGPGTQIGDAYSDQAPDRQAPAAPQVQPAPDGGHTMTIQNGARVEKWHFAPDGTTTKVADSAQPQQAQGPLSAVQLNPAELAILKHNAQQVVGGPRLTGNPLADRQAIAENQAAVNSLSSHFIQAEMKRRQNEVNAKAVAARQATADEAKDSRQAEREAHAEKMAEQKALKDEYGNGIQHNFDLLRKDDGNAGKGDDELMETARRRQTQIMNIKHGRPMNEGLGPQKPAAGGWWSAIFGGGQPAPQQAGAAGAPNQQPAEDPAKADLEQTLSKHVSGSVPVNAPSGMPEGRDPAPDELAKAGGITPEKAAALHHAFAALPFSWWEGMSPDQRGRVQAGGLLRQAAQSGQGFTATGAAQLREAIHKLPARHRDTMLQAMGGK